MEKQLTKEELRQMVVNSIRENGLNDIFKDTSINDIVENLVNDYKIEKESQAAPSQIIPEGGFTADAIPPVKSVSSDFPTDDEIITTVDTDQIEHDIDLEIGQETNAFPSEIPSDPVMYRPELPIELQGKEPSEFIVWDYNEISVGGENLSNKPFKTIDDPEVHKTMVDAWKEEGKTVSKIFVAKFEEIGEVHFDYVSGQSHFIEKGKIENINTSSNTYNENPYATQATPQIDKIDTEIDLAKSIESSVDLEKALEKVLKDIIQKGLNSTIEAPIDPVVSTEIVPVDNVEPVVASESFVSISEMMNPNSGFEKKNTPNDLKEALKKGNSPINYLITEMKGVNQYCKGSECYYIPKEPMSLDKCYIKS